jgi:DNA-directed RNA polymerase subunit RPC12/RpoP
MDRPHRGQLAPFACFECRKSFKRPQEPQVFERQCPHCGGVAHWFHEKFKPPKSDDRAQWRKVQFLFEHGFRFQPVSKSSPSGGCTHARYPNTFAEAERFVTEFKSQAFTQEPLLAQPPTPRASDPRRSKRQPQEVWKDAQARARGILTTTVNAHGWVRCPHCGWRFTIRDKNVWDGQRHIMCGTYLTLKPYESTS